MENVIEIGVRQAAGGVGQRSDVEDADDLFHIHLSGEPAGRLPFTGPSVAVGRTSTFACSTCGTIDIC